MDTKTAEEFAVSTLEEFKEQYPERLTGYEFRWGKTKSALGRCFYGQRRIELSKPLVKALTSEDALIDVVLHEIAHALSGPGTHHGPEWKHWARKIGCTASRCYSSSEVIDSSKIEFKYTAHCNSCGAEVHFSRKWKDVKCCKRCCDNHNNGEWSNDYIFRVIKNY